MAADGSIIIDTRIDTDGISSGVKEVQAAFKDLANSVKEINANINSIFHDGFEKLEDSFQSLQQKSEKVENSMDKMGNSAKKTGTTVSNSFNKMDISGASRKVNLLGRQFEGLGTIVKRIGFLVGSAFAVGKLIQFGKESIELGSDLAEVQNVVDVTFTTMSDKVNEFAKNAMTSAGLSETMAKRYVGTFGAMSKSFGFSEAQAYDMSTALTQLTGDVASFYNISQDLAYIKLKSVFTGETETLKDLGVVMTQSALDQYALANGYGKTTSAMTEQEKVALRLAFVQKQLSAASGDFIRTSDSWANQVRVMQLQLQSLKATVGQGLINLFTPVLKVINILLGKLATLANAFKSFTELITGKKSSGQTGASGAGLAGTDAIANTADQYGQAADNAEKLADANKDNATATKKANKETKSYLSSLDEIHKATSTGSNSSSTPSSSSGSGGAGNSGLPSSVGNVDYGNLAEGETALDKISDSAKKLADLLKKLWKPFQDAWKKEGKNTINAANIALSGIAKLAKSVGKSLVEVWTNGTGTTMLTTMLRIAQNVLKTIGNIASGFADAWNKNNVGTQIIQNIADALVVVMQFVEKIAEDTATWAANLDFYPLLESISNLTSTFAPILESIGNVLEWIYDNIVLPMLKWVIEVGLPTVVNLVSSLVGFFADHQSIIEAFGTALIGAFAAAKIGEAITSIMGFVGILKDGIVGLIALMTGSGGIMGGLSAIATAIGPGGLVIIAIGAVIAAGVLLYKNWDTIKAVAKDVWTAVVGFFKVMAAGIAACFRDILQTATGIWSEIKNVFVLFGNWLKSAFSNDWTKQFGVFGNVLNAFFRNVKNIVNSIRKVFDGLINLIVGVFTGDWWEGVKQIFSGVWQGLASIVKSPLNAIIGGFNAILGIINSLINKINGISFKITVPDWVPKIGGSWWGFNGFNIPNIGTIPYLAKGAVIPPRSEFLAVLGDQKQGNNIEAPEGLIREIIDDAFARHQQNSGNVYNISAQAKGKTIFELVLEEGRLSQDRTGRNPFLLA